MLDFDPFAPVYPSHVQDNDSLYRLQAMQVDPIPYSPYSPPIPIGKFAYNSPATPHTPPFVSSPGLQSFTFDPFADEDSSTSSAASERERELVVQRLHRIEFLRRREWMRRVVAWVDGISHDTVSSILPSFPGVKTNNTDMNCALFNRAPHYHRPLRYQSLHLPLDLTTIPNSPTPRTRLLSTIVRVRRMPAVRMRMRSPISSTALLSQAPRKRRLSTYRHRHPPLYLSP